MAGAKTPAPAAVDRRAVIIYTNCWCDDYQFRFTRIIPVTNLILIALAG